MAEYKMKSYKKSAKHSRRAIEINPHNPDTYKYYANSLKKLDEYNKF
jgi:hypothetical protein